MLLMTPKFSHLSQEQRYKIEALLNAGHSRTFIADSIDVHKSTISRELKRNSVHSQHPPDKYKAVQAQRFSEKRAFKKPSAKSDDYHIARRITWLLKCGWSPEQISMTCKQRYMPMLSIEAIYLWIYSQPRKQTDLTNYLRRHHRKRRKRKLVNQPRTVIKNKTSIDQRPVEVDEQKRFGDMETDLVKCQNGYLLTITERRSLFNFIVKLPNKEAKTIEKAIIRTLIPYKDHIKTITSDNGTEFALHQSISAQTGITWYFADPYKSQQRGCNENQNGLIRQYFKRNFDLQDASDMHIKKVQDILNARPRKKNNFVSPTKLLRLHNVAFDG